MCSAGEESEEEEETRGKGKRGEAKPGAPFICSAAIKPGERKGVEILAPGFFLFFFPSLELRFFFTKGKI